MIPRYRRAAWVRTVTKFRVNEIETIAAASDYISLHFPVARRAEGLGEEFIHMMKPTASLLNFSRGELVDHEA